MFTKLLLLNNIYINIYIYIYKMVFNKNKNKDEDEHYDIKEHYDENSLQASDIPWYSYLGMIAALFLLVAFGWWARDRIKGYFYPTDKTETKVSDNSKPVTADLVYPKVTGATGVTGVNGVTGVTGATGATGTTREYARHTLVVPPRPSQNPVHIV